MSKKMTPCEKLGYKVGDKFVVLTDDDGFEIGSIVELWRDDDSICPIFRGNGCDGVFLEAYLNACQPESGMIVLDVMKVDADNGTEQNFEYEMKSESEITIKVSDWHKNGELPPVGEVCEAYIDYPPQWVETEIVAHKDSFAIGWCKSVMKGCHGDKAHEFRPLRTERVKAINEMMEHCDYLGSRDFAGKLFDAGYRKEVK